MADFEIVNDLKGVAEDVLGIRDEIGAQKALVYKYVKNEDTEEVTWTKITPTPDIVDLSHNVRLQEGGAISQGDLFLKGFPISKYTEQFLETATVDGKLLILYVLKDPNGYTRAYTVNNIKKNYLTFDLHVTRYEASNDDELNPPEEDS